MKFVQKSKELDAAVDRILSIFNRLVVTSGSLESGVRFQRWREAVKEIRRELDSVRTIANRTDYVPPTLIGVDKFIHWTENLGGPGHPFPDWQRALYPSPESIAGHPWLLKVESRFDLTGAGWMVRLESPTADPVLVRVPTTPEPPNPAPSDVPPSDPVSVHKGKGKGIPTPSEKIEKERTVQREMDDEGESEVVGEDVQMDEDTSDQVRGRSKKRARSTSESRPMSTRRKSQSRARQSGTKGGGSKGEGTSSLSDAPMTPKPKYGRAQVAARTTPPPDPNACSTCVNRKVVCTWTVGNIPCDPCKKWKIGCGKGNVRHASTARTPKTPAKPQATPTPRTSPRPRTTAPPPAADDAAQPPRKKARISKRTEVPPKEVEASTSSAPQRRVTVVICPPQPHPKTHAVPPPIRDEVSANAPLPAPPIPPSHHHSPPLEPTPIRPSPVDPSNVSWNCRLDDIIQRQDLIFGRVDEVDRRVAEVARQILGQYEDRLRALEGQFADCRLTVGTLTREIETLRASVHGGQAAQSAAPPPVHEDLVDFIGPSSTNAAMEEAQEPDAAQHQGLVFGSTPSGVEEVPQIQQDPTLATQVEGSSSALSEDGSGAVTAGNEGGSAVATADEGSGTAATADEVGGAVAAGNEGSGAAAMPDEGSGAVAAGHEGRGTADNGNEGSDAVGTGNEGSGAVGIATEEQGGKEISGDDH
ncbi:hypothetical protein EDD15DRAFT_2364438 [Pisolithus albus]|nr:hypothetical protein EDD15DRAFT_2364438 [Pisolithus albus]